MGKHTMGLFVGAALAAGLAAPAFAEELEFPNVLNPAAFLAASAGNSISFNPGPGYWDEAEMSGDSSARTTGARRMLRLEATAEVDGLAFAIHNFRTEFRVFNDVTATVSWDTSGDVDGPGGDLVDTGLIIEDDAMVEILNTATMGPSGSTEIALLGGRPYTFRGAAVAGVDGPNPGGTSFVELAMPPCDGDLDGDGDVDVFDFAILADNFSCGLGD